MIREVGLIGACCAALIGACCAALAVSSAAAQAAPPREAAGFFGMNIQFTAGYSAAQYEEMGTQFERLGVGSARVPVSWNHVGRYGRNGWLDWREVDRMVELLARHRIRALPMIFGTPQWAVPLLYRLSADYRYYAPQNAGDFGAFAGQLARRYGPGGTFWTEHPELTEPVPITAIELWNEPNLKWAFRPKVDPAKYGEMYRSAKNAIEAASPSVLAVVGGLSPGASSDVGWPMTSYMATMGSSGVEAVAIHPYGRMPDQNLGPVRELRGWMDGSGLGGAPIYVTEWGFPDERFSWNGQQGLAEAERSALFRDVTSRLSRSDCNVAEVHPHTWDSDENTTSGDAWTQAWQRYHGLANPLPGQTGFDVYGEGEELGRTARESLGREGTAARETVHACGRPAPDRDRDGVEDQHDYAPLDPAVVASPTASAPSSFEPPALRRGDFAAGKTVETTLGTWDGSPLPQLAVQRWEHCNADGGDCQPIPDSASRSLTLPDTVAGRRVRATVRAVNPHGEVRAATQLSDVVGISPRFTEAPTLHGTFAMGQTVWLQPGAFWAIPAQISYLAYQWYHCAAPGLDCRPIGGPSSQRTLKLELAHVGRYIKGVQIAGNVWGTTTSEAYSPRVALF